jgi:hypothetical protein
MSALGIDIMQVCPSEEDPLKVGANFNVRPYLAPRGLFGF